MERREVPAALSVSDVTVREGPANLGILDPSGAASVGLNGIRGIAFDNGPGNLYVTGALSHSVARFDQATQTYQPFVAPDSGGLGAAYGITVGPDGNVYVSDRTQNIVFRYDGSTGAPLPAPDQTGAVYVAAGSGGLLNASGITFGSDGNLYVCSRDSNVTGQILTYQGPAGPSPGSFLGVFVNVTNGSVPCDLTFGPDGNLYVSLINAANPPGTTYGQINRYNGSTGAPVGTGVFVPLVLQPRGIVFDALGTSMYVVEAKAGNGAGGLPGPAGQVLRYQGPGGPNPGAYVETFITGGQGELSIPIGLARDGVGNLYVSERDTTNVVKRFAPSSQASFTVTLDSASADQVSVDYATANGTAAGSDYAGVSGTLVFAPGETSKTVAAPILDDLAGESTETFRLNLTNPVNTVIADGQGVGTILDNETKFFVVDSDAVKTYEYGSGGTSEEITIPPSSSTTAPRGVATTAAGTTVWVVDANRNVYVYNNQGLQIGSWSAGSLASNAIVEDIATNGTDIWIVDAKQDKVFRYTGAASRLSGSQNAANSFNLASGNKDPKGIVTNGTYLWVVNDSTTDKVFKYTLSGSLLGSWTLNGGGGSPTGITLDPSSPAHLWVMDNGTDRVYQYDNAIGRTSGSQAASGSFALNPYNTNPQGIADPPAPGLLLAETPALPPALALLDWHGLAGPAHGIHSASLTPGAPGRPNHPSQVADRASPDPFLAAILSPHFSSRAALPPPFPGAGWAGFTGQTYRGVSDGFASDDPGWPGRGGLFTDLPLTPIGLPISSGPAAEGEAEATLPADDLAALDQAFAGGPLLSEQAP